MESDDWSVIQQDIDPVQFVGLLDKYSIHYDLELILEFGSKFVPTMEDWIGLYTLGCPSLNQHVAFQWIKREQIKNRRYNVTFPKRQLPTNFSQYYQLMYLTSNDTIVAASAPIYFTPDTGDFVFVDIKGDEFELATLKEEDEDMKKDTYSDLSVSKLKSLNSNNSITIVPQASMTVFAAKRANATSPPTSISKAVGISSSTTLHKTISITNIESSSSVPIDVYQRREDVNLPITIYPPSLTAVSSFSSLPSTSLPISSSPTTLPSLLSSSPIPSLSAPPDAPSFLPYLPTPPIYLSVFPSQPPPSCASKKEGVNVKSPRDKPEANESMALVPWIEPKTAMSKSNSHNVLSVNSLDSVTTNSRNPPQEKREDDAKNSSDLNVSTQLKDKLPSKSQDSLNPRSKAIPLDFYEKTQNSNDDSVPNKNLTKVESKLQLTKGLDEVVSDLSIGSSAESVQSKTSVKDNKTEQRKKDAHLDQVVVRFFHFLGSVIARQSQPSKTPSSSSSSEKLASCSRCSQLEVDLQSTKSRANHAENREGSLIQELNGIKNTVKLQETRTAELLCHLRQKNDDAKNLALAKSQLNQCATELQQANHNLHRLTQEKKNLETKVGNLIWEKAALCAKLQVLQQGEVKYTRKATELSNALMEAQEEVHHLSRRQAESQLFIDGLLATLASLGFVCVRDPTGVGVNLENVTGPGLALEPTVDDTGLPKWSRKSRFSDKWYKAMMASQELIQQLQNQIRVLEEQDQCREESNRFKDIQKLLMEERKKNQNLQTQLNTLMLMISNGTVESDPSERSELKQDSPLTRSYEKVNYTIQEPISADRETSGHTMEYELQGARPKLHKLIHRTPMCEPIDEIDNDVQYSNCFRLRTACTYSPSTNSVDRFAPSCPYCGEIFPAYLLPADKQEHIRMHMYSELHRKQFIPNGA